MKEVIRKVCVVLLLVSILSLLTVQQHRVNLSKHNEQAADRALVKYQLENADLKLRLKARLE